jgi:hypothetical protein
MSWTFDPVLPTVRDRLRLRIGDTDSNDPLLTDETLDALLVAYPNEWRAAAEACFDIAAKYSREVDRMVGNTNIREGDRSRHYHQLGWTYRVRR